LPFIDLKGVFLLSAKKTFQMKLLWNINSIMQCFVTWHWGHRVRIENRRSQLRIPPGCKVFYTLQCV
jgi:hypothetical protein